ncbi:hypothetical protein pdam_00020814 [Pocillopora damicornis]|uniref:MULE transposase domain-containing protein n=1 Tax=Pocillopora damicornis TaxID=46731 RepID=A0A3M6TE12_POCDA|nr:hypothetical protein pdam_00020814 [Pocillopora damicornis]
MSTSNVFISAPRRYAKYLRRVIMGWIGEESINLDHVVSSSFLRPELRHESKSDSDSHLHTPRVPSSKGDKRQHRRGNGMGLCIQRKAERAGRAEGAQSNRICKINRNCTSTLNVSNLTNGEVKVEICYTHNGHTREIQHTWLPKEKRQELAAKIQQGVPREIFLDDVGDSVTENNFPGHYLLGKKDLLNIERAFGLKDFQRHISDQDSALAWITEWEQSADTNLILFYKFQDEVVKKNCAGSITSTWFMSDIAPQYNNAWVGFMNDVPRPQKLLCTWHVDKAINMELRKKIGDLSTEAEI